MVCIDEAHKAKGKYAYVEVIRSIYIKNKNFRVVALSATPGRQIQDVMEVIHNLQISHVEIRSENSIDVSSYTHRKNIKSMVIPLGPELTEIRSRFIEILDPYVRKLLDCGVITGNINSLSKNSLIMKQVEFKQNSFTGRPQNFSEITSYFSICISLYYALEVLERSGIQIFINFFEDTNNSTEQKYFVSKDHQLKSFVDELKEKYSSANPLNLGNQTLPNGSVVRDDREFFYGHPKYEKLEEILLDYFRENKDSRVIVFCELRESTMMVRSVLNRHRPLIKPRVLVGQGSSSAIKAVTQKEQIAVIKEFKSGVSNVLVATCVGEEGIDIGEVNLIVCMDMSSKNPTRFVQRIGRTGRQRQGKIIMLVTEGKEHAILKDVLANKDKTNQKIAKSREILNVLYKDCPRMVPPEFNPKCVQTFIKLPEENLVQETGKKTRKKKATAGPDQEAGPSNAPATNPKGRKRKNGTDIQQYFSRIKKPAEVVPDEAEIEEEPSTTSLPATSMHNISSVDLDSKFEKLSKDLKDFKLMKYDPPRARDVLLDDDYPNSLKRRILKKEPSYIKEIVGAREVLSALESDPEPDLDGIEVIKRKLGAMEKIFHRSVPGVPKTSDSRGKFKNLVQKLDGNNNSEFISRVKLKYQNFLENPVKKPEEKLEEIQEAPEIPELLPEPEEIPLPEPYSPNVVENQSRHNQTSYIQNKIFDTSTPVRKSPMNPPKRKLSAQNSPLIRAFENSMKKKFSSTKTPEINQLKKSVSKTEDFQKTLRFFGLESLDDIFADDEEEPMYDDGFTTSKIDKNNSIVVFGPAEMAGSFRKFEPVNRTVDDEVVSPSILEEPVSKRKHLIGQLQTTSSTVGNSLMPPKSPPISSNKIQGIQEPHIIDSDDEIDELLANITMDKKSSSGEADFEIDLNQPLTSVSQILKNINSQKGEPKVGVGSGIPEKVASPQSVAKISGDLESQKKVEIDGKVEETVPELDSKKVENIDDESSTDTIIYNLEESAQEKSPTRSKHSEIFDDFKSPSASNRNLQIQSVLIEILENDENKDINQIPGPSKKVQETSPSIFSRRLDSFRFSSQNKSLIGKSQVTKSQISPGPIQKSSPVTSKSIASILATQSPGIIRQPRKLAQIISSSDETEDESPQFLTALSTQRSKSQKTRTIGKKLQANRKACAFLDVEAGVSGSEDGGDDEDDSDLEQFLDDSLICSQEQVDHPDVDMQAKYLESVKSPQNRPGRFKIPLPRAIPNMSQIYSQIPSEDEEEDCYDSFVVQNETDLAEESQVFLAVNFDQHI
jgi:ERCC4-related helicase